MAPLIRLLVPALALVFASSSAFAEAPPAASKQEVSAPVADDAPTAAPVAQQAPALSAEREDGRETGSESDSVAAEGQASSSEGETGPKETAPSGTGPSEAALATEADAPKATSSDDTMPSHAPLLAHGEGAERRRRVPLVMFSDYKALARFTEAEPAIHEKARSIAARTTASLWVNIGSAAITGGLWGASLGAPHCEMRSGEPSCRVNLALFLAGVGTFVVGQVVSFLIAPKEADFREVVDAWNATIDEPIVPEPGLDPRGTDAPVQQAP